MGGGEGVKKIRKNADIVYGRPLIFSNSSEGQGKAILIQLVSHICLPLPLHGTPSLGMTHSLDFFTLKQLRRFQITEKGYNILSTTQNLAVSKISPHLQTLVSVSFTFHFDPK